MDSLKKRSDILERKMGEEHMLYDVAGRKVHVLNKTAYFIWGLCDGVRTLDDMVHQAAADFKAEPGHVKADIEECIQELRALSLLE